MEEKQLNNINRKSHWALTVKTKCLAEIIIEGKQCQISVVFSLINEPFI